MTIGLAGVADEPDRLVRIGDGHDHAIAVRNDERRFRGVHRFHIGRQGIICLFTKCSGEMAGRQSVSPVGSQVPEKQDGFRAVSRE